MNLSIFVHKLVRFLKLTFNLDHNNRKPVELRDNQQGKHVNNLESCYRCHGSGSITTGLTFGDNISRVGGWDGISRSPYTTCPICKGTGHVESFQSNNNEGGETKLDK